MWINLDDNQMTSIESALAHRISGMRQAIDVLMDGNQSLNKDAIDRITAHQIELQALLDTFGEKRKEFNPADPYRAFAKSQATDEVEIDDDAIVSPGGDPGAWVHAWVWVTNEEAGLFSSDHAEEGFDD